MKDSCHKSMNTLFWNTVRKKKRLVHRDERHPKGKRIYFSYIFNSLLQSQNVFGLYQMMARTREQTYLGANTEEFVVVIERPTTQGKLLISMLSHVRSKCKLLYLVKDIETVWEKW